MDAEEYGKQLEAYRRSVEESLETKSPGLDGGEFLDKSKPTEERVAELRETTARLTHAQAARALEAVLDRQEQPEVRANFVKLLAGAARDNEQLLETLIALLRDVSEPSIVRLAVLALLQFLEFNSPILREKRASVLEALRSNVDDPDPEMRAEVLEALAQEKDEYVQRRLIDGLRGEAEPLVRPEKAIQLLGYDIHAQQFPLLREIAQTAAEPVVRREAVRLLSADPESKQLLIEVFQNKREHEDVRRASARALLAIDPVEFRKRAKDVVLDEDDDDNVRAASLSALDHFVNPAELASDEEFKASIDRLEEKATAKPLDKAIRSFKTRHGQD